MDVELLMDELGRAGVSVLLRVDVERMQSGCDPWTMMLSGPALGEGEYVRADGPTLGSCLKHCLREVAKRPGDWSRLEAHAQL